MCMGRQKRFATKAPLKLFSMANLIIQKDIADLDKLFTSIEWLLKEDGRWRPLYRDGTTLFIQSVPGRAVGTIRIKETPHAFQLNSLLRNSVGVRPKGVYMLLSVATVLIALPIAAVFLGWQLKEAGRIRRFLVNRLPKHLNGMRAAQCEIDARLASVAEFIDEGASEAYETLERLGNLLEKGHLTKEEYEGAKRQLLGAS